MKKLLKIILSVLLCAMSLLLFVGCDGGKTNAAVSNDGLQFDVKYIERDKIREDNLTKVKYYVFNYNGMGEFHDVTFYSNEQNYSEYTIYFKYTYLDVERTGIMCFFDSYSDYIEHKLNYAGEEYEVGTRPNTTESSNWDAMLSVSKNIVMSATNSSNIFINENFVKQIPNYEP